MEPLPLVSGRDYPNTYREFVEMFPNDTACATYLAKLRWPVASSVQPAKQNRSRGKRAVAA